LDIQQHLSLLLFILPDLQILDSPIEPSKIATNLHPLRTLRLLNAQLLGSRIRAARERLGLSQEELAVAVSKDQHAISQYERGTRKLAVIDLPAFARALNAPLLYFFEGEISLEDLNTAALSELRRLPTVEAKQTAINFIRGLSDLLDTFHH
jgi:transcriptional regulator with XRE-family HTH domain